MDAIWSFLGWIGFGTGLLAGLLMIPLGLGGTFVILALGLGLGLVTGFERVEWQVLVVLAFLAVMGEVIESFLGIFTVRRFGASKHAMLGTFVGGIAGGTLGTGWIPVVGSLIGAFAGAFAGAVIGEVIYRRKFAGTMQAGWAAFLGRVAAAVIKFEIGVVMVILLVWRVLENPPQPGG